MKTIDELRNSDYHQQLGQKLWAAFVAQQQGISMNTALKNVDGPVCDEWLIVAEYALLANNARIEQFMGDQTGHDRLIETFSALRDFQSAIV